MHKFPVQSEPSVVGHPSSSGASAELNGASIPLSPAESGVLACLLAFRDRPVSRATLLSWLPERDGDASLADVLVFRLRRKFARACGCELIENVPGAGYCVSAGAPLRLTAALAEPPAA